MVISELSLKKIFFRFSQLIPGTNLSFVDFLGCGLQAENPTQHPGPSFNTNLKDELAITDDHLTPHTAHCAEFLLLNLSISKIVIKCRYKGLYQRLGEFQNLINLHPN